MSVQLNNSEFEFRDKTTVDSIYSLKELPNEILGNIARFLPFGQSICNFSASLGKRNILASDLALYFLREDLSHIASIAIVKDNENVANKVITSINFDKIPIMFLHSGFYRSSARGNTKIVKDLINSSRFKEFSPECLRDAFTAAAKNGHKNILINLLGCSRGNEINKDTLNSALIWAAETNQAEIVEFLLTCDRAQEITIDTLASIFKCAYETRQMKILKVLENCNRFMEIQRVAFPDESVLKHIVFVISAYLFFLLNHYQFF